MRVLRGWWREFAGLVLPVACGGCGRPRAPSGVCGDCADELAGMRPGGERPGRVRPAPEPPGLPAVHAAVRYENAPRAVLLAHKERGTLGLVGPLGAALASAVRSAVGVPRAGVRGHDGGRSAGVTGGAGAAYPRTGRVDGPAVDATQELVLVPVPSARRSVGARGHDPVRRIARAAAAELRRTGTPARIAPVLRQRRRVGDQAGLGARERLANLAGALEVVAGGDRLLEGGRVVLVDDLMTTGATLVEAARALTAGCAGPAGERVKKAGVRPSPAGTRSAPAGTRAAPAGERETYGTVSAQEAPEGRPTGWRSTRRRPGKGGIRGRTADPIAAVVAAPPNSFEINWN
ncbi:ComF family protein [Streptomyces sp. NPDC091272]|uniref:ComF family protein n=1 Tax=Streptomyces sp. NPDC091272 TaxID=3365981 RepID=UPI00381496B0